MPMGSSGRGGGEAGWPNSSERERIGGEREREREREEPAAAKPSLIPRRPTVSLPFRPSVGRSFGRSG